MKKRSRKKNLPRVFSLKTVSNPSKKLFHALFKSNHSDSVILQNIGTLYYNYSLNSTKTYNVISMSLFIMKDMYKTFHMYIDGARKIATHYKKYFPNFILRVYFDGSLFSHAKSRKFLLWMHNSGQQLVMYDCPKFKSDSTHHQGTFGTLMRYLPYFQHVQNDVKCSFVIDADTYVYDKTKFLFYLEYYGKLTQRFIHSRAQFMREHWVVCMSENHIRWVINPSDFVLGSTNASKMRLPMDLLSDFLTRDVYEIPKKHTSLYKKCMCYKKKNHPIFWYGIDEYFLSNVLKVYLDKQRIAYATMYRSPKFAWILTTMLFNKKVIYTKHDSLTLLLKRFNTHFKTSFRTIQDVITHFGKTYDYKRKTNKHLMYSFFREEVLKLHTDGFVQLTDDHYKCLLSMKTYWDDTNNFKIS